MGNSFKKLATLNFIVVLFLNALVADGFAQKQKIEPSIFGPLLIEDQVIIELLESPVMERLRHIDQSGTPHYFTHHVPNFTRYDHSVGVYALLKKVGAPLNEQIAGLLHDASHTVFSHTGDWVVGMGEKNDSYQDDIHEWHLKKMNVPEILQPHGLTLTEVLHKGNGHCALEQELPDMCADRIEYNLHTAFLFGMMSKAEINEIVDDLHFEKGKWFFTKPELARKFANLSIYFTQYLWGSPYNQVLNHWSGKMLKRALDMNILTKEDFHFGLDEDALNKLKSTDDPVIKEFMGICNNYQNHYKLVTMGPYDFETKPKFRGIDPLIQVKGKLVRLTKIDSDYNREFLRVRDLVQKGIRFKFL